MATYLGAATALAGAGAQAYAVSQTPQPQSGTRGGQTRIGVSPPITALQSYDARLLALNANNTGPTFSDFVGSGGKASYQLQGAGQFTPAEAQRLSLVGANNAPTPWFDPTQQNRLSDQQVMFIGADRAAKRRQGSLKGPLSPEEQYYTLSQDISRKGRTIRNGKVNWAQANRLTRDLGRATSLRERLAAEMFGSPDNPYPYELSGGPSANRPLYQGGPNPQPDPDQMYTPTDPRTSGVA